MLTISVKNFGPIAEGSVDLKPLTIFVGPSNTGKSYMATAVHAVMRAARSVGNEAAFDGRVVSIVFRVTPYGMGNDNSDDTKAVVRGLQNFADKEAINQDLLVSDLPESVISWLRDETGERLRIVQQHTLDQLLLLYGEPSKFAKYGSQANRTSLSVSRHTPQLHLDVGLPQTVNPTPEFDISKVSAPVQAIELLRRIPLIRESDVLPPGTKMLLVDPIVLRVLDGVPTNSYYLPASRSGIIRVERPLTSAIIRQSSLAESQRMGLPVSLGVTSEFLADFVGLSQENRLTDSNADLDKAIKFLENKVLHGEIDLDESAGLPRPDVTYETEVGQFTIDQTSSMVSELAPLILFLKYLVRPGDLLILEEPESHLHPAAQRQLARGIVRLVNAGVKVLITTHSETFVAQVNHLLRISYASKRWLRENGFTPEDCLKHEDVSAYMFRMDEELGGNRVDELEIQRDIGIDDPLFNDVINALYEESLLVQRIRIK